VTIADSDPRVFFAAERTLLAWLRTGLTIVAIGFVIARFGLFVHLLSLQVQPPPFLASPKWSAGLGVTFVILGSVTIFAACWQHVRFVATLASADLPPAYSRSFAIMLSSIVAALSLVLAGYLAMSSS